MSKEKNQMDIVITTIFPPTRGTKAIAEKLATSGGMLWVMGDEKGPSSYELPATRFFSLAEQRKFSFELASLLPARHYARKNLGYLCAAQRSPDFIVETDDDNIPLEGFWTPRQRNVPARATLPDSGWVNTYRAFTSGRIWPRGFPLEKIQGGADEIAPDDLAPGDSLVQQGLANGDPDVDAIYRMICDLPFEFESAPPLRLTPNCWCPFNSQNTTFFREAFPLLYLPFHCSFRMTDIWRSFVAQRCLWEMHSSVLFSAATVFQERNEHDLRRDFEQEVPGYLRNADMCASLASLKLQKGRASATVCDNLRICYEQMVSSGAVGQGELALLQAWCRDIVAILG